MTGFFGGRRSDVRDQVLVAGVFEPLMDTYGTLIVFVGADDFGGAFSASGGFGVGVPVRLGVVCGL